MILQRKPDHLVRPLILAFLLDDEDTDEFTFPAGPRRDARVKARKLGSSEFWFVPAPTFGSTAVSMLLLAAVSKVAKSREGGPGHIE